MRKTHWAAIAASLALSSSPTYAHHSYAEFDMEVTRSVSGTLKEFNWVSPHTNLKVAYVNDQGVAQEITVTTGSPAVLSRQGFKAEDFVLGSRVTMSWHPNRSGTLGGELAELKLPDGRVLKGHGAFPAFPGGGGFGPPPGGPPPGGPPPGGPPPSERAPNVSEKPPATG